MITRNVLGLALSAIFLISVASNCDDGGSTLSSDGGNSGADADAGGTTGTGTGTGGDNIGGNGGTAVGGSSATGGAIATGGTAGGMGGQRTGGNGAGGTRNGGAPGTGGAPIVDLTCNPGAICQANATCNGACQPQQGGIGSRACSCVNGKLTCDIMCTAVNIGNPMACPANPQGAACGGLTNCQIGQNPRDNCACLSNKLVCPTEAPPANTPACAANVNFTPCPTDGAYCSRNNGDEFCFCTSIGGNQRWLCQFR